MISVTGYSKTPFGEPNQDQIRFTCTGLVEGYPQEEVFIGSLGYITPNAAGRYSVNVSAGIYLIELKQSGQKEWVEQGTVRVDGKVQSPISIKDLVLRHKVVETNPQ